MFGEASAAKVRPKLVRKIDRDVIDLYNRNLTDADRVRLQQYVREVLQQLDPWLEQFATGKKPCTEVYREACAALLRIIRTASPRAILIRATSVVSLEERAGYKFLSKTHVWMAVVHFLFDMTRDAHPSNRKYVKLFGTVENGPPNYGYRVRKQVAELFHEALGDTVAALSAALTAKLRLVNSERMAVVEMLRHRAHQFHQRKNGIDRMLRIFASLDPEIQDAVANGARGGQVLKRIKFYEPIGEELQLTTKGKPCPTTSK